MKATAKLTPELQEVKDALDAAGGEHCVTSIDGTMIFMTTGDQLIAITAPAGKNFLTMTEKKVNKHIQKMLRKNL